MQYLITVRYYNDNINKALAEIHGNKTAGATRAVEAYLAIRTQTLREIKNMFTKQELIYLSNILLKGKSFDHNFCASKAMVIAKLTDENFSKLIIKKINKMTSAQIYFLCELIEKNKT